MAIDFVEKIVAAVVLIREAIQSQNYIANSAGWRITAAGDAEFNNLVARGSFISGDGTGAHIEINGDIPNGISFHTGDGQENSPGRIVPSVIVPGSVLGMELSSPTGQGGTVAQILMSSTAFALASNISLNADSVDILGAISIGSQESWHNLALVNSWVQFSGALTPDYRLNIDDTVTMRGVVKSGTTGVIATLPAGYRPTKQVNIGLKSNNDATSYSWVQILTNGVVQVVGNVAAAQVWLTLDLSFSTHI